jgi:CRP/FNR family transcriptional regulator
LKNVFPVINVANPAEAEDIFSLRLIQGRDAFCGSSAVIGYPAGCTLFRQGFPAQGVFCIHSGLVKLVNVTPDGKERITGLRSTGWILGAASAIIDRPYRVTAVTVSSCEIHHCRSEDFVRFAKLDPEFSWHLLQLQGCELYDQTSQLITLGTLKARQRLEHLLSQVVSTRGQNGQRLELPLKLEEIAQWIAVEPEHLSRLLRQLEAEGAIKRDKGWIIVPNPQRLARSNQSRY